MLPMVKLTYIAMMIAKVEGEEFHNLIYSMPAGKALGARASEGLLKLDMAAWEHSMSLGIVFGFIERHKCTMK